MSEIIHSETLAGRVAAPRISQELRQIVGIALPLSLSQLSEMAMGVTDALLLGSLGATALAVGGLATSLFFVVLVTFQSGLAGVSVLIARARGEAHHAAGQQAGDSTEERALSGVVCAGLLLACALCLPMALFLGQIKPILHAFGEAPEITGLVSDFMQRLMLALPPYLAVIGLLRVILPAFGYATLLLWTMPVMAVLNGLTNAALIHGLVGLPRLGLFGSATATALTGWAVALVLLGVAMSRSKLRPHLRLSIPDWGALREMVALGLPMMFATGAEVAAFQVTGLRAGHYGTAALAAHQVALSVTSTLFMVNLALAQAANVRVAFWIGARRAEQARNAAIGAIGSAMSWSMISGVVLLLFPEMICRFYLHPDTPMGAESLHIGVQLLRIAAFYQIFDGIQVTCAAALRAYDDTVLPMLMIIGSYGLITLLGGGWLADSMGFGVLGLWYGLAGGLAMVGIVLPIRLWLRFRREMRHPTLPA